MRFREEILRGIRLGAICFALLLVWLAAYRVLREGPAPDPLPQTQEVPPQAAPPAETPSGSPLVPPPPPLVAPRRSASIRTAAKPVVTESIPNTRVDTLAAPEEKAAEPIATEEQEKEGPDPTAEKAEAVTSDPAGGVDNQKSGNRGKRLLKAVGRFLHISPKKDLQGQAVRQP